MGWPHVKYSIATCGRWLPIRHPERGPGGAESEEVTWGHQLARDRVGRRGQYGSIPRLFLLLSFGPAVLIGHSLNRLNEQWLCAGTVLGARAGIVNWARSGDSCYNAVPVTR